MSKQIVRGKSELSTQFQEIEIGKKLMLVTALGTQGMLWALFALLTPATTFGIVLAHPFARMVLTLAVAWEVLGLIIFAAAPIHRQLTLRASGIAVILVVWLPAVLLPLVGSIILNQLAHMPPIGQ